MKFIKNIQSINISDKNILITKKKDLNKILSRIKNHFFVILKVIDILL